MSEKNTKEKAVIIRDKSLEEELVKLKRTNLTISDDDLEVKNSMNLKEKLDLLKEIAMLQEEVLSLKRENRRLTEEVDMLRHYSYYSYKAWDGSPEYCYTVHYTTHDKCYSDSTVFNDNWDMI